MKNGCSLFVQNRYSEILKRCSRGRAKRKPNTLPTKNEINFRNGQLDEFHTKIVTTKGPCVIRLGAMECQGKEAGGKARLRGDCRWS